MIDNSGGCFVLVCVFSGSIFKFESFQKYHLKINEGSFSKTKLKALASQKSFSLPKFQVPDFLFFTLSPLPPLEPRTETPTRPVAWPSHKSPPHWRLFDLHQSSDQKTRSRDMDQLNPSWFIADPYKFLMK